MIWEQLHSPPVASDMMPSITESTAEMISPMTGIKFSANKKMNQMVLTIDMGDGHAQRYGIVLDGAVGEAEHHPRQSDRENHCRQGRTLGSACRAPLPFGPDGRPGNRRAISSICVRHGASWRGAECENPQGPIRTIFMFMSLRASIAFARADSSTMAELVAQMSAALGLDSIQATVSYAQACAENWPSSRCCPRPIRALDRR